ncbi:MAG: three-Cys-motif partner protein TcmP [Methylocystis sp.]|uniref:three-Cys-motif partner protein TcmP n=1 Tax=Methylocystis sp. TaxID=1911079 RepID=UPI003D138319
MSIAEHEFGGVSTDLKLAVVEGYLRAFTTALRPYFRELWYIDAFAGTGERTERLDAHDGTLFDPATPERIERHRGSATIAIDIEPPFDRIVFIERNPKHCAALELLRDMHPRRDIQVRKGVAEKELATLLGRRNWESTRAVMFLDPYGMSVPWEILEAISSTRAIDVWYLVSLSGLFRQATLDWTAMDAGKRAAITRMLGTSEWESKWYERSDTTDLFGTVDEQHQRTADVDKIESFVRKRLETIFPKVLSPLRLHTKQGAPMFALFFAIANPDPKAIGLATKIAGHMLKVGRSSHTRP